MLRIIKHCRGRTYLDDLTRVHDRDPVAQIPCDRKVVRDEQDGYTEATLMMANQIEDLALDQIVEIGCRLVGNDKLRSESQHHANEYALQHAATQLMRIGIQDAFRCTDAHLSEQVQRIGLTTPLPWLAWWASRRAMACRRCQPMVFAGLNEPIGS